MIARMAGILIGLIGFFIRLIESVFLNKKLILLVMRTLKIDAQTRMVNFWCNLPITLPTWFIVQLLQRPHHLVQSYMIFGSFSDEWNYLLVFVCGFGELFEINYQHMINFRKRILSLRQYVCFVKSIRRTFFISCSDAKLVVALWRIRFPQLDYFPSWLNLTDSWIVAW